MVDHAQLAQMYAAAARTSAVDVRLQRFTEITSFDESACDAWVGRIACGQVDRTTLFRSWFSRRNFGRLASAADLPIVTLNAAVPIGGQFADLQAQVTSVHQLSIAYALAEAAERNFDEALEALCDVDNDDMGTWARACVYAEGARWDEVIDTVNSRTWGQQQHNRILKPCVELLRGIAAAHLSLWVEAQRRIETAARDDVGKMAVARSAAWYLSMIYRQDGRDAEAVNQLQFLQASYPSPKVDEALRNPKLRLEVTTREQIAARTNAWDADSTADTAEGARSALLNDAQDRLDHTVGLIEVKEQVADLWAGAEMATLRAERNKKVSTKSRHMVFAGPPGTGKTTIAEVVADIYAGLGLIKSAKIVSATGKDLISGYLGQTPAKTNELVDSALDGVLFIDEVYTIIQAGADGNGGNQFGHEAIDALLARMENDRGRLIVIIAGYPKDVDRFLDANDGLRGRFTTRINFPGYSADEIVQIAKLVAAENDSTLTDAAAGTLEAAAAELAGMDIGGQRGLDVAGNGRHARNIVEAGEKTRDRRLSELRRGGAIITDEMLELIEVNDMMAAIKIVNNNVLSASAPPNT